MMRLLAITLILALTVSRPASACSPSDASLDEVLRSADLVFEGVYLGSETVIERRSLLDWATSRDDSFYWWYGRPNCRRFYRVTRRWHGDTPDLAEMIGSDEWAGDCDANLELGQTYIVVAYRDRAESEDDLWDEPVGGNTIMCSSVYAFEEQVRKTLLRQRDDWILSLRPEQTLDTPRPRR